MPDMSRRFLRHEAPSVEVMDAHGIVLGVDSGAQYQVQETTLEIGDRVVLYTDGLTEASNDRGELFTLERLREQLLEHRYLSAQDLADRLFDDVKIYSNDNMRDDATIFVVRRSGEQLPDAAVR
jgi:sigma-B regulation protein RsbU (phosphoserine phosphatase)